MVFTTRSVRRYVLWLQLIAYAALCGGQVSTFITSAAPPDQWTTWFSVSAACFALVYVTIGFGVFLLLRNARRRARAIRGRPDLAPLARLDAPLAPTTAPTTLPLAMQLQPTHQRLTFSMAAGALTLMSAMCLALGGFFLAFPTLFLGSANTTGMLALFVGLGAVLAASGLWLLWFAGVSVRRVFRCPQPVGIVADEAGIRQLRGPIRERLVRWEDARLIEVAKGASSHGSESLTFTVFARRTRVTWTMPPPTRNPVEVAAFQVAHGQLLALLKERAHLEPRTFERSLHADHVVRPRQSEATRIPQPGRPWPWRVRLVTAAQWTCLFIFVLALSLLFAVLLLGLAYACVAVPLTGISALDDYAAVATLAPALLIARLPLGFLLASRRREVPLPYLPPAPAAVSYEFRWRLRPRTRIGCVLGGVVLVPAGALGVWAFVRWSSVIISPTPGQIAPSLFLPVAIAGTIVASMFGSLLLWRGITGMPHSIRADARGLIYTRAARGTPTVITWDDIKTLTLTNAAFGRATFTLHGRDLGQLITWPAHISVAPAPPSADGTQTLTPAELAAVVAIHTGLALRT